MVCPPYDVNKSVKPIFLGLAARKQTEESEIFMGLGENPDVFTESNVKRLIDMFEGYPLEAINIMHTNFTVIDEVLPVLKKVWPGPIGVKPDNGYFKIPFWESTPINEKVALEHLSRWKKLGVTRFGGCCGTDPTLIKLFASKLK